MSGETNTIDFSALHLNAGDVLLIKTSRNLNLDQIEKMRYQLKVLCPDHKAIVIGPDADLSILRYASDDEQLKPILKSIIDYCERWSIRTAHQTAIDMGAVIETAEACLRRIYNAVDSEEHGLKPGDVL